MAKNWDVYSRQGLDLALNVSSFGFSAVKAGTRLGFAVTRGIASAAVGLTTTVVDHALFGGSTVTRPFVGSALSTVLSLAEQIALAPIFLSEYITSSSLLIAHSSINALSSIIPGSSEASFSLASFITLVKREWTEPVEGERLPTKQFGLTQIGRAVVAWVALQGVTQEWQEKRWLKNLREIHVKDPSRKFDSLRDRRGSRIRVTSDVILPNKIGQLISADIGDAPPSRSQSAFHTQFKSSTVGRASIQRSSRHLSAGPSQQQLPPPPKRPSNVELKATLRRFSKLVLAGYGGASLLFFGVSPSPPKSSAVSDEKQLAQAINASEAEAGGYADDVPKEAEEYSWWDVLLGNHDHEIFERFANAQANTSASESSSKQAEQEMNKAKEKMKATAKIGSEHLMPRFWVLTDHGRRQIVLILRGTMSLNEIAADLTCEAEEFEPATTTFEDLPPLPGQYAFPSVSTFPSSSSTASPRYHAHSGMVRMARAMGGAGKPVQVAVCEALTWNIDYDLVLAGHSLGAGVAAILGLMWADPKTCLTVSSSGLPPDRRVSVYCFAPPALTDPALSRLASNLITSFVYSHDVVSRLSLGSIRDLRNAAMWLCHANDDKEGTGADEGYTAVTARAGKWKAGKGSPEDPDWFIAVRKTLEANMHMADMFPPGRVLWAMRDSDLHPSHRLPESATAPDKLRLFDVLDVEKVFEQIVFARDMLSAHMPHQYDRVLHELL